MNLLILCVETVEKEINAKKIIVVKDTTYLTFNSFQDFSP